MSFLNDIPPFFFLLPPSRGSSRRPVAGNIFEMQHMTQNTSSQCFPTLRDASV